MTTEAEVTSQEKRELANYIDPGVPAKSLSEVVVWSNMIAKTAMGITAPEAMARILIGQQWGMDPVSACQNIYNIQGKYMFHYSVLLGRIKQAGYRYRWIENTDAAAEIEFSEKMDGEYVSIGKSRFTLDDARKAKTQNMEKWARVMLAARAVGIGVRLFCADAFNGMVPYAQGEIEDQHAAAPAATKSETLAAQMKAKEATIDAEFKDVPDANPETGEIIEPTPPDDAYDPHADLDTEAPEVEPEGVLL